MPNKKNSNGTKSLDSKRILLDDSTRRQLTKVVSTYRLLGERIALLNRINFAVRIPRIYTPLPEIKTPVFDQIVEAALRINSTIGSFEQFSGQIQEVMRDFGAMARRVTADLVAIDIAFQNTDFYGLFKRLSEKLQAEEDVIDAFRAAGWPIAPSMPVDLRKRVVELHRRGRTRYASQSILGYYRRNDCENLVRMVNSWQNHPLFHRRMHIFRTALNAHREGNFILSIPALLPQIEGVLTDFVRENDLEAKFGQITEVYTIAIGSPEEYGLPQWAIINTLLYQLQTNTYVRTPHRLLVRRMP